MATTCPDILGLSWAPQETLSPLPCGWLSRVVSLQPGPQHQDGCVERRGTGVRWAGGTHRCCQIWLVGSSDSRKVSSTA